MRSAIITYLDSIGFSASILCAVHCATVPILLTVSTWGGLQALSHPSIELTVLSISAALALTSVVPSYFRHHKSIKAILLVITGFVSIVVGRFVISPVMEIVFTSAGAAIVAAAHLVNWWLFRECELHKKQEGV